MALNSNQNGEILEQVKDFSVERFGDKLVSVILYGSYARGDYEEDSDIDIMILVDMDAITLSRYQTEFSHFGTGVDLRYDVLTSFFLQDKNTFDSWKNILPFYQNVIAEGVSAYG